MNKKMRELLAKIEQKTTQARAFMDGENKDVNKATELLNEVDSLQAEYETEKRLFEMEKRENAPTVEQIEEKKATEKVDSVKELADMARRGFPKASMTEGVMADGGYTVPEDISTRINEYRDSKFSLRQLVSVENVTTNKGARTFKARGQLKGFTKVGEGGKIGASATPKFERLEYTIDKYAGYLPVTNELLADSDENISNTIINWLGDEARVTDNVNILEVAKTFTAKTLGKDTLLDDIKAILNKDLGQAFKPTARVITNDSGLQVLDTLKDVDGKYVLQPNPADPMKFNLCAGANVIPLVVIPNSDLADDGTKIPFFIGDMAEAIRLFDRESLSIATSNVASIGELNAFEEDLIIWRGILRQDVVKRDASALYFATLDNAPVEATGLKAVKK